MKNFSTFPFPLTLLLSFLTPGSILWANPEEKLDQTQGAQIQVDSKARSSQKRVSQTAEETRRIVDEYRESLRKIENTKIYNEQLRRLIKSQEEEMVSIDEQVKEIRRIREGIFPLMLRMLSNFKEFIALDVPFLMDERQGRYDGLKALMNQAKVSTSEKFRRLLEAYQIENDYGRTLEAYRGLQEVDGQKLTVDFLRVGRLALVYQTLDGKQQGFWDSQEKKWKELSSRYSRPIQMGLRMARKQTAPQLITLPVFAPKEVSVEIESTK